MRHRTCGMQLLAMVATSAAIVSTPARAADNAVDTYGTAGNTALWLPAAAFHPWESATTYIRCCNGLAAAGTASTGGVGGFWAEVNLPAGAVVSRVEIHHYDNSAADTGFSCFTRYNVDQGYTEDETCAPFPAGTPGNTTFAYALDAAIATINNRHPHVVHIVVDGNAPDYAFYGARIVYRLGVSPAPATATFPSDVPTNHPFFRFVEAMAASGITGGCGPGRFCPDQAVTRGQMAVFLATALGLHFSDVATIP
jgi:hypothetical protein